MLLSDAIGLLGVVAYLVAYALLQLEKLKSSDNGYLLLNAAGSILILVSLVYSFNLPSFVSQFFWLVFTVIGFYRTRTGKGRGPILTSVPEPDTRPAMHTLFPGTDPGRRDDAP